MLKTHKAIYFILAIVVAISVAIGLLFAIQSFRIEEEIITTSDNLFLPKNGDRAVEVEKLEIDIIASWKNYRNEERGFEFKYPKDWQKDADVLGLVALKKNFSDMPSLNSEDGLSLCKLSMDLVKKNADTSFQDWHRSKYLDSSINYTNSNILNFQGKKAIRSKVGELGKEEFVVIELSKTEILSVNFVCSKQAEKMGFDEFESILNTFKFIEQNEPESAIICSEYKYSSCPETCKKACVPSSCGENGICTADCEGKGSCINPD